MNNFFLTLITLSLLAISAQNICMSSSSSSSSSSSTGKRLYDDSGSESSDEQGSNKAKTKRIVRSVLLPDSTLSEIEYGKITAEGIELDLDGKDDLSNETFEDIVSNPNGACLAYNPMTRRVCDVSNEKYGSWISPRLNEVPTFHLIHALFLRAHPSENFSRIGIFGNYNIDTIRKALAGDSDSQDGLGYALNERGLVNEAISWFEKAAQQNNPSAHYNLGICTHNQKNYSAALIHFKAAQELGDKDAYAMLAEMYEKGKGVDRDMVKAEEYRNMFDTLSRIEKEESEEEENEKQKKN